MVWEYIGIALSIFVELLSWWTLLSFSSKQYVCSSYVSWVADLLEPNWVCESFATRENVEQKSLGCYKNQTNKQKTDWVNALERVMVNATERGLPLEDVCGSGIFWITDWTLCDQAFYLAADLPECRNWGKSEREKKKWAYTDNVCNWAHDGGGIGVGIFCLESWQTLLDFWTYAKQVLIMVLLSSSYTPTIPSPTLIDWEWGGESILLRRPEIWFCAKTPGWSVPFGSSSYVIILCSVFILTLIAVVWSSDIHLEPKDV